MRITPLGRRKRGRKSPALIDIVWSPREYCEAAGAAVSAAVAEGAASASAVAIDVSNGVVTNSGNTQPTCVAYNSGTVNSGNTCSVDTILLNQPAATFSTSSGSVVLPKGFFQVTATLSPQVNNATALSALFYFGGTATIYGMDDGNGPTFFRAVNIFAPSGQIASSVTFMSFVSATAGQTINAQCGTALGSSGATFQFTKNQIMLFIRQIG